MPLPGGRGLTVEDTVARARRYDFDRCRMLGLPHDDVHGYDGGNAAAE